MRPAFSRVVLWISLLFIAVAPFTSAQTDTWTGSGGTTNWSNSSNWDNGAITTGENVLINLTTAATVDDFNVSIGNLTLSNAGDSVTTTGAMLTVDGTFSNAGSLTILGGSSFTVGALSQISGTTLSGGTYVLGANLDLSTGTANITTNSATLTLEGGTIENTSNGSNALLNLAANTKSLTLANNANFTTTGNFKNTGTLTVNSGSTFTVLSGKTLTNYRQRTDTLMGGTYVVGGTLAFNMGMSNEILTDSANLTLEGSGEIENTTRGARFTNALANLSTISSTGSLTLANNANFTTAGNFSNNNKLIIDSGSTFAVTGFLNNMYAGVLFSGSYTVAGTLQLGEINGSIGVNETNLTLIGPSAKILRGSFDALNLGDNTGTFNLLAGAALVTDDFTNSGTVDVGKGSELKVCCEKIGRYRQTAGQTTIDGTLSALRHGATVMGGTILGAGTVKGNLSVGNGKGTAATINVGDSGKAGLLSITGTYTQLATGTMTGLINGTAAGTGFSQLKVTGTAALAGTINFTVATAFQSSLTLGETFTVLTSSGVSGTFKNSTIAINGTFQFDVSYTATGVVLTVASTTPNGSSQPGSQTTTAMPVATTTTHRGAVAGSGLRRASGTSKISRPVVVAAWAPPNAQSGAILAREKNNLRRWEHVPVISGSKVRTGVVVARVTGTNLAGIELPKAERRMGENRLIGMQPPLAGWVGTFTNRRMPVKIMAPMLSREVR